MGATILAVSPDRGLRNAVRDLLDHDPDFLLVGEAENGDQALRSTSKFHPDVVLMDATAAHVNGVEAARKIKSCEPFTKVILLSALKQSRAFKGIGPDAFVAKSGVHSDLLPAIRGVLAPAPREPGREATRTSLVIVHEDGAFVRFAADYLHAQAGLELLACIGSGTAALTAIPRLNPDVALVDLELPDVTGFEIIGTLRRTLPDLSIIAFSSLGLERYSKRVFAAGAHKFIPKNGLMSDLVPAILTLGRRTPANHNARSF